jgi:hypothetical protein
MTSVTFAMAVPGGNDRRTALRPYKMGQTQYTAQMGNVKRIEQKRRDR